MALRIVVTGATGFLGRHFAAAAAERGHTVVAHARRPARLLVELGVHTVVKDLLDADLADLEGADAVVHFATGTDGDEQRVLDVAVEGTRRLARLAVKQGVPRFVHVSSMSVYSGDVRREAVEPHPQLRGLYARSKTLAEDALRDVARDSTGIEWIVLRPGLVFGAGMKSVLAGTAVELPFGLRVGLGRRTQSVPFVELEDLVSGLLALLEREPTPGQPAVYDVLSGDPPSKAELVAAYGRLAGRSGRTIWTPLAAARAAAAVLDRVRPGKNLVYNVTRMYRFEPRDLPHAAFWRAAGSAPSGTVEGALRDALTVPRRPAAAPLGATVVRTAGALLRAAAAEPAANAGRARIVLVGAGRIVSEMHLRALATIPNVDVAAVVDPVRELRERVAAESSAGLAVPRLEDLDDEVLRGAVAVVATPGYLHAELGSAVLERGASLLLEKPAAVAGDELAQLQASQERAGLPVTVFQNYRLRPRVLDLWRFLRGHDVGGLVSARLVFHSPRIDLEAARWMHEEKRVRALLMEMSIHFVDLACVVGGPIVDLEHVSVVGSPDGRSTVSVTGAARMERCDAFGFDLDLSGTAPRTRLELEFERVACVLDFYPDGFRILPRKPNPLDDAAADARRFADALSQRLRPSRSGVPRRAAPHRAIYLEHLRRLSADGSESPLSLEALAPTMESLYLLAGVVYDDAATVATA